MQKSLKMSANIEFCSGLFECLKITAVDTSNSSFTHPKKGFARLAKDNFKYSYVLELFLDGSPQRPAAVYNVRKVFFTFVTRFNNTIYFFRLTLTQSCQKIS